MRIHGRRWDRIAEALPNRKANVVKAKIYTMKSRLKDQPDLLPEDIIEILNKPSDAAVAK